MKVMIKILRALLVLVLCAVLAMNVWLLVQQTVLGRDAPEVFGYSQYIVSSGSMEPAMAVGDLIFVKSQDSYELGDVVTFRMDGGAIVTHRIVGRVEGQFITRGDANNTDDQQLLPPGQIIGKLRMVLPGAGAAVNFLRSPLGILILLAAGALLIKLPDWLGAIKKREE